MKYLIEHCGLDIVDSNTGKRVMVIRSRNERDGVYIGDGEGEGGVFDTEKFVEHIMKFYTDNF